MSAVPHRNLRTNYHCPNITNPFHPSHPSQLHQQLPIQIQQRIPPTKLISCNQITNLSTFMPPNDLQTALEKMHRMGEHQLEEIQNLVPLNELTESIVLMEHIEKTAHDIMQQQVKQKKKKKEDARNQSIFQRQLQEFINGSGACERQYNKFIAFDEEFSQELPLPYKISNKPYDQEPANFFDA